MSDRIPSFTEYALLNRWALDCFSPTAFQKRRIASTGRSALRVLKDVKVNPYSNLKNSSYLYYANKFFISTPLKVAYIAGVTLILSRLGVIVNGFLTVYSYCRFKITSYENTNEAWTKTKDYAFAFFADLSCAVVGAVLTKFVIESTFHILHFCRIGSWMGDKSQLSVKATAFYLIVPLALVAFGCAGLAALQSPSFAPQFFARSQDRVGMYLSMILREGLGIVTEKGGLLPFSEQDQLQYTKDGNYRDGYYYQCKGSNYETLKKLIFEAEWELLETVKKCQAHLPNLPYQYPFDGEAVARLIEAGLKVPSSAASEIQGMIGADASSIYRLSAQLKSLATKIKVLNEIFKTSQELTMNDSLPMRLIKAAVTGEKSPKIRFEPQKSFISEDRYRAYYNMQARSPGDQGDHAPPKPQFSDQNASQEIIIKWDTFNIPSIDPGSVKRPETGIFEKFRYDVGVNKRSIQNGKVVKTLRELLDLSEEASYSDYKKQQRLYSVAVHPDKNKHTDAAELFTCLGAIIEKLDQEYEKQISDQNALQKITIRWDAYDISPIDPGSAKRPETGLVDEFRYDICVDKWNIQNGKVVKSLRQLLGLSEDASYSDYKKQQRLYWVEVHPNKNKSLDAKELFRGVGAIINKLDQEYDQL